MRKRKKSYKKPWSDRYIPVICFWVVLISVFYFIATFPWLEVREVNISLTRFLNLKTELQENHPELKDFEISYRWPNKILFSSVPRKAVLSVCFPECFLVDDEGIIFADGEYVPRLHISNYQPILGYKIPWSLPIFFMLKHNGFTDIVVGDYLEATHKDNWIAYLNWENLNKQINELDIIWDKMDLDHSEIEYIDLRFDKVILKRK
jgi:hypothetical protein